MDLSNKPQNHTSQMMPNEKLTKTLSNVRRSIDPQLDRSSSLRNSILQNRSKCHVLDGFVEPCNLVLRLFYLFRKLSLMMLMKSHHFNNMVLAILIYCICKLIMAWLNLCQSSIYKGNTIVITIRCKQLQ